MITCKQSTEWVIKKEYTKLAVKENLKLMSHLAVCNLCRLFQEQNSIISEALFKTGSKELFHLTVEEKMNLFHSVQTEIND
jgi:hypothetical protein